MDYVLVTDCCDVLAWSLSQGPGDICRLALSIEGWNNTVNWWNLDVLTANQSFQYMPTESLPILPAGSRWTFGFEQLTDNVTFPRVDPLYGETCDGRYFNLTSIIPSPGNPNVSSSRGTTHSLLASVFVFCR